MKYVVLIIDGASGWPATVWNGRTSLEKAHIPNLDRLAREGTMGLAYNVPDGMEASSAVACMSVMGFDPCLYYAGRGPIEAMAMGIQLEPGQVAMRCNLVTILDGRMVSYSAGSITSQESAVLISSLRDGLGLATPDGGGDRRFGLHAGVGFRHILTVRDGADLLATTFTVPHDIADRMVAEHAPMGPGADIAIDLMERSKVVLDGHPVNEDRIARGLPPATQIWLFWPGMRPTSMPTFSDSYGGRRAGLNSAVDLLRGLAIQTGVDFIAIPGVTDGGDNDFEGQMAGALAALEDHDVVFVHVEAPDEASHSGDGEAKVYAIEQTDALMVPQVIELRERLARGGAGDGVRLLVMPDHPTPLETRTHVPDPVPFVVWGAGFAANGARAFSENEARATGYAVTPGHRLMSHFLEGRTDTEV